MMVFIIFFQNYLPDEFVKMFHNRFDQLWWNSEMGLYALIDFFLFTTLLFDLQGACLWPVLLIDYGISIPCQGKVNVSNQQFINPGNWTRVTGFTHSNIRVSNLKPSWSFIGTFWFCCFCQSWLILTEKLNAMVSIWIN